MKNLNSHAITLCDGRQLKIEIPVPLPKQDKERLKAILPVLIDLAIDSPDEPHEDA